MKYNNRVLGSVYEKIAEEYLLQNGYIILEMNFRCKIGEIDIIAKEGEYIVFIEVKFRTDNCKGYPLEAVNTSKQRKIRRVAEYYLISKTGTTSVKCRFDAIGIMPGNITLVKNAF